jgi:hypothetical protein
LLKERRRKPNPPYALVLIFGSGLLVSHLASSVVAALLVDRSSVRVPGIRVAAAWIAD